MKIIDLLNILKGEDNELLCIKTNNWFIGWDYNHLGDYNGYDENKGRKWTTEEINKECKYVINQIVDFDKSDYINDILDNYEEKKIPEKIIVRAGLVGDINNKIENLDINIMTVEDKLNQVIDYLKSKEE